MDGKGALVVDSAHRPRAAVRHHQIIDLESIVQDLPEEQQALFGRLYAVSSSVGRLSPPDHMRRWIDKYFGSVDAVTEQKIVKVTNRLTLEESLFNELRARRPLEARIPADLADEIARTAPDPF